jgi:dTDP-4-dehydrorhamnose reductase
VKILLTGRGGQVGSELQSTLKPLGGLLALDRSTLDLTDAGAVRKAVREAGAQVIVNAAAYTAVDRAESEPDLAMRVNGEAPGVLAEEAKKLGALLVHYSTDYVFDGRKASPYLEDDPTGPLGVYGRTKLAGEDAIRASGARHLIVRTAWVYGRGRNFVRAIARQAESGAPLRVVNDQFGAPTWARDIAALTAQLIGQGAQGTVHVSAAGQASWYEVALEVLAAKGLRVPVHGVTTAQYGAPAPRPGYSVLDNSRLRSLGVPPIGDWRARLRLHLQSAT